MFERLTQRRTALLTLLAGLLLLLPHIAVAQVPNSPAPANPNAAQPADATDQPQASTGQTPTVWDLAVQGGYFMIPIALCSIVVIALSIERLIGLRQKKVLPPELLEKLDRLNSEERGLDPREAYRLCQQHTSPLSNVIRAAILKIGRPHSEVEKTVEDAVAREASDLSKNIRPINVCASISPLLGLLGTVQGMIMAFMVTSTTTATGTAKAQELAQGIYTALVTTFAGLCVAILAVVLAHYLEGCIDRLLREMEDIFLEILPQFERYEGKLRITRKGSMAQDAPDPPSQIVPSARKAKRTASKTATGEAGSVAASTNSDGDGEAEEPGERIAMVGKSSPKGLWAVMDSKEAVATGESDEPSDDEELSPSESGVIVSGRKAKKK